VASDIHPDILAVLEGRSQWCVVTGDAAAVVPTLPTASIGAIITDPPFGIGFKYNQHDDNPDGYGPWLWSVLEGAERATEPGSPVFVWQAMPNAPKFSEWFPRQWRIFAAAKNFVQMRPTPMQYSFDPVVVWWTEGEVWADGTASRDFHIANTNPSARTGDNHVPDHPCPRPLEQVRHIVTQWARPGAVVLDPFCGSGTTGLAAVQTGRRFVGVEIDEKYAAIARRRIADAAPLFVPPVEARPEPQLFGQGGA